MFDFADNKVGMSGLVFWKHPQRDSGEVLRATQHGKKDFEPGSSDYRAIKRVMSGV